MAELNRRNIHDVANAFHFNTVERILTLVYLPASTDEPLPAIIAWSPYGKNSGNADRFKNLFGLLGLDQKRMSGLQKFEGPDPDFWCAQGYAIVYPDPQLPPATLLATKDVTTPDLQ